MAKVTTNVVLDAKEAGDALLAAAKQTLPNNGSGASSSVISVWIEGTDDEPVKAKLVTVEVEFNCKG